MCYSMLVLGILCVFFFFFKQKTAYDVRISDWSSDVCSSDLSAVYSDGKQTGAAQEAFAKFHASGGEWRIEKQRLRWDILDAFSKAAQQAGIPASDDFNQGVNEGVGYFEVNQKDGWRWNAAKAFLRPACQSRANFTLWTQRSDEHTSEIQ